MTKIRERILVQKVARLSIIINAVQIALMLVIALVVLLGDSVIMASYYTKGIMVLSACVVVWGAAVDIREALMERQAEAQVDMLREAMGQLEALNLKLRAQRHDFMNHLQVVYSLMELGESGEAMDYIERTFEDILTVSRVMKTSSPAINALLMAKTSDAKGNGINMQLKISSPYSDLPMESWEMCRVLGNLLDNAIDALSGVPNPRIEVELTETLHSYGFKVFNNGPAINPEYQELVFQAGFTTKASGTGMGLAIVSRIMQENGGNIELRSDGTGTAFTGTLPKLKAVGQAARSATGQGDNA